MAALVVAVGTATATDRETSPMRRVAVGTPIETTLGFFHTTLRSRWLYTLGSVTLSEEELVPTVNV